MYPRLIFMDLEGTLLRKTDHLNTGNVAPSAWALLAERLGPDALREEKETQERWNRGGYRSYIEWMQDTIRIHKKYRLNRDLFEEVMASVEEMPGARDAVETFKHRGAITAIISGALKALADRMQRAFRIDHAFAGCEYFFDEGSGELEHWNLLPSDYEGKVDLMRVLMRGHKISKQECAFIGDGKNDVYLAEEVAVSIAFNAQPDLKKVCTYTIDQPPGEEDFRAVAERLDRHSLRTDSL